MFGRERPIFREKALQRISSPDDLDEMIQIIGPKDWLIFLVTGVLLALLLAWGFGGRIPVTREGRGLLVSPESPSEERRTAAAADPSGSGALVNVSYFPVEAGAAVRPGMRVRVVPDGVEPRRMGGIPGVVLSVSGPVSREEAAARLGSSELVRSLLPAGPGIEVVARLDSDPRTSSGYRWTSSAGPSWKLAPGMATSMEVTVASRRPVSYLLPAGSR
jgi:hypothetical protein